MGIPKTERPFVYAALVALAVLFVTAPTTAWLSDDAGGDERLTMIVQAADVGLAEEAALESGGRISHRLPVIDAVAADIPAARVDELRRREGIRLIAE